MNNTVDVPAASAAISARRGSSASIVALSAAGCCSISWNISDELTSFPPKTSLLPARERGRRRGGRAIWQRSLSYRKVSYKISVPAVHELPAQPGGPSAQVRAEPDQVGRSSRREAAEVGSADQVGRDRRGSGHRRRQRDAAAHRVADGDVEPERRSGQRSAGPNRRRA